MPAHVQRWGNSLALRLPKSLAERVGIAEGSAVELEARGNQIVVCVAHRYRLKALLKEIRRNHIHLEVSTGKRRGREAW